MDNLDIGRIAIGIILVEVFNLAIILLTKTETILKIVERIKGVVGLDYKNRAKRSTDEIRISKRHAEVAKARVRHSFVTMQLWQCRWTWNWSDSFEPINIKGYCLGNSEGLGLDYIRYRCNQPVYAYYNFYKPPTGSSEQEYPYVILGVTCTDYRTGVHRPTRVTFQIFHSEIEGKTSEQAFLPIISKAILSERDLRVAKEVKKLRLQFWR